MVFHDSVTAALLTRSPHPCAPQALRHAKAFARHTAVVFRGGAAKVLMAAVKQHGKAAGVLVSDERGMLVCLVTPSVHRVWLDLCLRSGQLAHAEASRRHAVLCDMAVATTMGGGWASVKNAEKALEWALRLMSLAVQIGDEATVRKCRVFVGWALLWRGDGTCSREVFEVQQEHAQTAQDEANHRRCVAALLHHRFLAPPTRADGQTPELGTAWEIAFAVAAAK